MSGAALRIRDLVRTHPGAARPALDHVDLDVEAGRILALLGASGAGKTSLLRIVAGLEPADHGTVSLEGPEGGLRLLSDPGVRVPPWRRGIGLVFQHLELWPHMTVAENIAFGLPGRPRGRRAAHDAVVRDVADRVGVAALLDRRPATLSGGERQRVAIARTLAPDPGVLLYDEPLANLDPSRRADLRGLIRTLCRERGTTLVYVTHDPEEAMAVADELAVLHAGRLVERGLPDEVYHRPRTLAGARALGPVNALPARVEGGRARTSLGEVAVADGPAAPGDALALLRPEAIRPGDGTRATVVDVHPRGEDWSFTVHVDGRRVLGRSNAALVPGASVALRLEGPAVVLPLEEVA